MIHAVACPAPAVRRVRDPQFGLTAGEAVIKRPRHPAGKDVTREFGGADQIPHRTLMDRRVAAAYRSHRAGSRTPPKSIEQRRAIGGYAPKSRRRTPVDATTVCDLTAVPRTPADVGFDHGDAHHQRRQC